MPATPTVASAMRLDHVAEPVVEHLFGRLIRRSVLALVVVLCAVVALYFFTAAGLLALRTHYDALLAQLIVGAVYTAAVAIFLLFLWMQNRANRAAAANKATVSSRELQFVMLIEAVMLGYELSRKRDRIH